MTWILPGDVYARYSPSGVFLFSHPSSRPDAPLAGKTVLITGSIAAPRSGEKVPAHLPTHVREAGRDHGILGLDQHRHAHHRRQRGRQQTHQDREARRRGGQQAAIWQQLIAALDSQ
jgi:hypothetical protein